MAVIPLAVLLFIALPFLLELWAIRLGRREGVGSFVRVTKYVLPLLFVLGILVAVGVGLVEVFSSQDVKSPATLISGVATAINCGAFFFLVIDVFVLILLSAISFGPWSTSATTGSTRMRFRP